MGKHAAPRKPLLSRPAAKRATAVSLGTFVLCLGAAAPALATTTTPAPPPLPKPISDTVQQVSKVTGLPNPIAPDSSTPSHNHRNGTHKSKKPTATTPTTTVSRTSKPATHATVRPYAPGTFSLTALSTPQGTRTAALSGRQPSMAGSPTVTRIAPAAEHRALINLPGTPAQQDTERILLVAAATLLLGGLASGHLKAAQERMIAW